MKSWKTIVFLLLAILVLGVLAVMGLGKLRAAALMSGYEVKYQLETKDEQIAAYKEEVKQIEVKAKPAKMMDAFALRANEDDIKRNITALENQTNQMWFLRVKVTTKKTGSLGVNLATQDGKQISSALVSSPTNEVIGDDNTYVASPFEIEDLGDNKFQISQGKGTTTGGSTQLVKLGNRTVVLVVEHADKPFHPAYPVYKAAIKLPPQSK